ncbi:MAG: 50S ribosomal protein L10 [Phycisphaera sp.]|nr:MAG: 50S ribosomal protein L10 [Phycisphaera sp.]
MSKPMKDMMVSDYQSRLGDSSEAIVVSLRGIDAEGTETVRSKMRQSAVSVAVMKNSLARKAFEGTALEALNPVMKGQNALIFGERSVVEVAREFIELIKDFPDIELKGAVLDGELYEGDEGVKRLSQFPTRDEALSDAVGLILGPGRNLLGQIKGPGSNIAGLLKAIEDKLEKGEAISKN